jgi:hypothetical protein
MDRELNDKLGTISYFSPEKTLQMDKDLRRAELSTTSKAGVESR